MGISQSAGGRRDVWSAPPVVPLELFFDLVFVFVLSQITHTIEEDHTTYGLMRGLVYLLLLWTAWVGFAWIGNAHRAEDGDDGGIPRRLLIILAMAVLITIGMVLPQADGDLERPAALLYFVLFLIFVADYLVASRHDPRLRRAVLPMLAIQAAVPIAVLVVTFAVSPGWGLGLIGVALIAAYAAPSVAREGDWQFSAQHADERFSLLMLIVLGESLISIGLGAADDPFGWPTVGAIALGVFIVAGLWWQYFDVVAHQGAAYLDALDPHARIVRARMIYTYLHVLLVLAVMLMALGLNAASADPDHPMQAPQALFLPGGAALFLATLGIMRLMMRGRVLWPLPVAAIALVLVIPLALHVPALVSEAVCVAILATLTAAREIYARRGVIQPIGHH